MADSKIKSVLVEERLFAPPAPFAERAQFTGKDIEAMCAQAEQDPNGFWKDLATRELHWHKPFTKTLDESNAPNYQWFTDGELNVSWNCLDVHLAERGHKTALIFEGESGDTRRLSYRELHAEVCRFANALKAQGVKKGDRVVIYMPLVPEIIVAMHACARIGAVHSVVFGGFSAPSLKDRIEDAGAKVLITADGGWRGGHIVELKAAADKALSSGCRTIERVIVCKRTGQSVPMQSGRDVWWEEVMEGQSPVCDPEWVESEHPLFLLYTSGSTGKPKGIQHSSAGYLLGAKTTSKWVFDLRDDDIYWCTADVGWVTGHSYVAYGPLAAGATVVIYEGGPMFPDGGRFWKICQDHGVTIFYTAPTAIRALMKLGDEFPKKYDLSKLRLLGSVGEPINPEAWMWYHRTIGGERCPIVDTWWQTETGAIMISPVPGVTATKPGSCTKPLPGIAADIVDDNGETVKSADAGGYLVIRRPWPSMLRTIWGDNERYVSTYWEKFQNRYYVAGDSAHRDKDGYFWIMGRIDDVLNVAGHRLGTMEIESALVSHPRVAEAAVVGRPHDVKGESVFAFVVCRGERPTGDTSALVEELRKWVSQELGAIARPDDIRFADNLPKTRSGKIMRRLLRTIARGDEITQDVSTLENPAIIDQLRGIDTGATVKMPALKAAASKPSTPKPSTPKAPTSKSTASKPTDSKSPASVPKYAAPSKAAAGKPRRGKASKPAAKPAAPKPKNPAAKTPAAKKPAAKKSAAKKPSTTRVPKPVPKAAASKPRRGKASKPAATSAAPKKRKKPSRSKATSKRSPARKTSRASRPRRAARRRRG